MSHGRYFGLGFERPSGHGVKRFDAATVGAVVLLIVYVLTLAPDVTFWDAGEFIAAAHSLGIPHPPGTPLFILLVNAWSKLFFFLPFALATNLFSAVATACAAGIVARMVQRATGSGAMAFASAIAAGGMSSVWLNATETEVYAASLLHGVLMIWAGERAGREGREEHRQWTYLTAYLMALAVPLHLSALVAAPVAIALAAYTPGGIHWRRALLLAGVFVFAMGAGRMSLWMTVAGALLMLSGRERPIATLAVAILAVSALAFLYVRAQFDPAINQGETETFAGLADMVARRQYDVSPIWPRKAPAWVQIGNLGQYADWQVALSFGPTVLPSVFRTLFTVLFLVLGYQGAVAHWKADRRTFIAVAGLLLCGSLGVLVYLNLHAGPSIGYGLLPANVVREARERDYFFMFAFWAWGIWAGIGAVAVATRMSRPAWAGVLIACFPLVLNWRAVTRRGEPEQSLPRTLAEAFLESTPRNGVLFVVGDNDSYPLWYAQQVQRTRPDVAVITIPLLPTDWYRAQIASRFGLLEQTEIQPYEGKLETAAKIANGARRLGRPIAAAMTVTPRERARLGDDWSASGLVYVEGSAPVDTAGTRRMANWVEQRLGQRAPRPAIDPVHSYFRRVLDCPRTIVAASPSADTTRLDSACNYR